MAIPKLPQGGKGAPPIERGTHAEHKAARHGVYRHFPSVPGRTTRRQQPDQRQSDGQNPQNGFYEAEKHIRPAGAQHLGHRHHGADARTVCSKSENGREKQREQQ